MTERIKGKLIDALNGKCESLRILIDAAEAITADGKIRLLIRPMRYEFIRAAARGMNARYPEYCNTLCTHDLDSVEIKDLGGLISTIRIGE